MMGSRGLPPRITMLVEPQSLLRSTVAAVARQLQMEKVRNSASVASASQAIAAGPVGGLLLALDDDVALELMAQVRAGQTPCRRDMPTAGMATYCDKALALRLRELEVRRILLKPFKVKSVLDAIVSLCPTPASSQGPSEAPTAPDERYDLDDDTGGAAPAEAAAID